MKVGSYLIYLILFLVDVLADNDGHCDFMGISEDDWKNGYDYGKITDYTNLVVTIESRTPIELIVEESVYLTASVDPSTYVVKFETKDTFLNIDEDIPTVLEDLVEISGNFTFQCPDGISTLIFIILIQDSNNHNPKFNKDKYDFKLPKRTYEVGEDISQYGPEIIATDVDFSNRDIFFSIIPDGGITIETEILGNKRYRAIIKAENISNLSPTIGYGLIAYDHPWNNGEPHRNSRSQINFMEVPPGGGVTFKLNCALLFISAMSCFYNF